MIVLSRDPLERTVIARRLSEQKSTLLDSLSHSRVTTIFGSGSREDEVYIKEVPSEVNAGTAVDSRLRQLGFLVERIDPSSPQILEELASATLVLLNAHGDLGECGRIQGILDILGVPYTGSGLLGSSTCLDKSVFRRLAATFDLAVAPGAVVGSLGQFDEIAAEHGFPLVAKPLRGGSSVDLRVLQSGSERSTIGELLQQRGSRELLIEKYIAGRDFTSGMMEWCGSVAILPPLEIISGEGFYSEQNKMRDHWSGSVRYVVQNGDDAKLFEPIYARLEHLWKSLHLRGAVRFDFRLDTTGVPCLLEANTNPGLSVGGNLAVAARACEISFDELLLWILGSAAYDSPASGFTVRFLPC